MLTETQMLAVATGGGVVNSRTRPLSLGYCRKSLLSTETELAETKKRLSHFATVEGFSIGTVYVERDETAPAAFEALIEAVHRDEVAAVILPSLLHFALLGGLASLQRHFLQTTGARVLTTDISTS